MPSLDVDLTPGETVTVKLEKLDYETVEFDYLVPEAPETVTKTMVPVSKGVVTCDSNPYDSLGDTETGCKLLLHYDSDNDGKIGYDDWLACNTDHEGGKITDGEFDFVSDCYSTDTEEINGVCPGCWEEPVKKTVTFVSVPDGATIDVIID